MAKIKLTESNFSIIPEGVTTFKVVEVDDSKYEDFGKLAVKLQTADGKTHVERFSLVKKGGELNEGALKAWSYFARTCLNNYQADEIDTQDIVGCYITATVSHEDYSYVKDGETKSGKSARLNDYTVSVGFSAKEDPSEDTDDSDDLDNFLDED